MEIVFSDSEKGLMKFARARSAAPLSERAVCIGFALDAGDIAGGDGAALAVDGLGRRQAFARLWGRFGFSAAEEERFFHALARDYDALLCAARAGEALRVWVSNAPHSLCGFCFVCAALKGTPCQLGMVRLPECLQTAENEIAEYASWGDVAPERLASLMPLEREVSTLERGVYARRWRELMEENAPLRAVVNGRLLSVPVDFYDHALLQCVPEGEFAMAKLIGTALGKYRLGVSDGVLALRVEALIESGVFAVTGDADKTHPYGKTLVKTA